MRAARVLRILAFCLSLLATSLAFAQQQAARSGPISSKQAMEWFQRAEDRMNLRLPGSAPFHLHIQFHAYPGLELLPPNKAQILTGDGVYDEIWLGVHEWRREVTLGSYHAIESWHNHVRKMQASEDYIPSRVTMLMSALLNPISNFNLTAYLRDEYRWSLMQASLDKLTVVKIAAPETGTPHLNIETAYLFLPTGELIQSQEWDIVTTWDDDHSFAGKIVPGHIQIQADGTRNLLTAEASVEPAGKVDPSSFDIPVGPAEPGMTLRPLMSWEVKMPVRKPTSPPIPHFGAFPDMLVRMNFTRTGQRRDVEVIAVAAGEQAGHLGGAGQVLEQLRATQLWPAQTDGDPCQTAWSEPFVEYESRQ